MGTYVHRDITGKEHDQNKDCWCVPVYITDEEMQELTYEQLKELVDERIRLSTH